MDCWEVSVPPPSPVPVLFASPSPPAVPSVPLSQLRQASRRDLHMVVFPSPDRPATIMFNDTIRGRRESESGAFGDDDEDEDRNILLSSSTVEVLSFSSSALSLSVLALKCRPTTLVKPPPPPPPLPPPLKYLPFVALDRLSTTTTRIGLNRKDGRYNHHHNGGDARRDNDKRRRFGLWCMLLDAGC